MLTLSFLFVVVIDPISLAQVIDIVGEAYMQFAIANYYVQLRKKLTE